MITLYWAGMCKSLNNPDWLFEKKKKKIRAVFSETFRKRVIYAGILSWQKYRERLNKIRKLDHCLTGNYPLRTFFQHWHLYITSWELRSSMFTLTLTGFSSSNCYLDIFILCKILSPDHGSLLVKNCHSLHHCWSSYFVCVSTLF